MKNWIWAILGYFLQAVGFMPLENMATLLAV